MIVRDAYGEFMTNPANDPVQPAEPAPEPEPEPTEPIEVEVPAKESTTVDVPVDPPVE